MASAPISRARRWLGVVGVGPSEYTGRRRVTPSGFCPLGTDCCSANGAEMTTVSVSRARSRAARLAFCVTMLKPISDVLAL